ncbi:MAG: hypothetical protein ACUVXA_03535 [Candidatus Jordarchaeum sp.]|uniref:hypothetical protein n=1 Tax=Candidatus Jordarchaeum sp. TaxID=2823881 RepID=UPI0040492AF1
MSNTVGIREKATLIVEFNTWKKLNQLKNDLGFKSIDAVVDYLLNEHSMKLEEFNF